MTKTFSQQHTLPRLPIPSLKDSCAIYLHSLKPLLTPAQFAQSEKHVADFLASDLSRSLQQRLIDIDRTSPNNWLEDNFWLRKAYLEWRDPLMINSNWYILGRDDANQPKELLENGGIRPAGEFTYFQLHRAAHFINRAMEFKEALEQETLPVDTVKGKPLCMWQFKRIFGITRIPLPQCDALTQIDISETRHIIILVRDQIYKLPVYKRKGTGWERLSFEEIEHELLVIASHSLQIKQAEQPVGLLTSWDRDNWAAARNHLLALDPKNLENARIIENSLLAIALDDYSHGADSSLWTRTAFRGNLSFGNGHNRWFDKSITFAVESNGKAFLAGEHSPCDALLISYLWDHMLDVPCSPPINSQVIKPITGKVEHLQWKTDDFIARCLVDAQISADATAAHSDSCTLVFDTYGTDWVKKFAKVSPDAYFQMVLQLTYYRLHKKVAPTYETGSTRKYLHGRTETIRTCSVESKALVEGWFNDGLDAKAKYDLLVKATNTHRIYTQLANEGLTCDRHLTVLRLLNTDHEMISPTTGKLEKVPMHPMFQDPIFRESQTWILSTSGLQAGIRLMGTGFGAATPDGYGINYMAAPSVVKYGLECKTVPQTVTVRELAHAIQQTLLDMKDVCEAINGTEKQAAKI